MRPYISLIPPASSRPVLGYVGRVVVSLVTFLVLLALWSRLAHADAASTTRLRRYALIASSNDGGGGRAPLRFANSDASAMSSVLMQLGGLQKQDLILLPNANRARIEAGFDVLRKQLREKVTPGTRRELFVYYSGHSDEDGLLLGQDRITYRELRQWIQDLGAEVRIAVLDSCASGALVRLKGGAMRAPFLSDASTDARGHAFLTASSADEAAQESDRMGAAFFTHYLVSGLRGAADTSHDGRVTLGEAYQFAYNETLRRTEKSRAGAQHPAYDIQLAGTGDLVMTDLHSTDANLVLGDSLVGHIFVRDAAGRLLVELRKEAGYPVELGLGVGEYKLLMETNGQAFETAVTLHQGAKTKLAQTDFRATRSFVATTRGQSSDVPTRYVPFDIVVAPRVRVSGYPDQPVRHGFVLGLLGHSDELTGVQLSLAGNIVERNMTGVQASLGMNMVRGYGKGAQFSSGVNLALGGFRGGQSSFLNYSEGGFSGLQVATVANWAKGDFLGLQASSALNYNHGDFRGLQAAVVNVNKQDLRGLQTGIVDYTKTLTGAQIGIVNIGGTVSGAQIGVINIASKVTGLQLGVVNVANTVEGASIGTLPLVRHGYNRLAVWASDVDYANFGVKLGSHSVYTLLAIGLRGGLGDDTTYSQQFGLGVHLVPRAAGRLFIDIDLVASQSLYNTRRQNSSVLGTARIVFGYQVARHLAFTLGPTYNVETSWNGEDYESGRGIWQKVIRDGDTTVRLFPGLVAGIQL